MEKFDGLFCKTKKKLSQLRCSVLFGETKKKR